MAERPPPISPRMEELFTHGGWRPIPTNMLSNSSSMFPYPQSSMNNTSAQLNNLLFLPNNLGQPFVSSSQPPSISTLSDIPLPQRFQEAPITNSTSSLSVFPNTNISSSNPLPKPINPQTPIPNTLNTPIQSTNTRWSSVADENSFHFDQSNEEERTKFSHQNQERLEDEEDDEDDDEEDYVEETRKKSSKNKKLTKNKESSKDSNRKPRKKTNKPAKKGDSEGLEDNPEDRNSANNNNNNSEKNAKRNTKKAKTRRTTPKETSSPEQRTDPALRSNLTKELTNDSTQTQDEEHNTPQSPDSSSDDEGSSNENSGEERKKRKRTTTVAQACKFCREKHLKCDGVLPRCSRCDKKNIECSYQPAELSKKRGPVKGKTKKLEQLVTFLTEELFSKSGTLPPDLQRNQNALTAKLTAPSHAPSNSSTPSPPSASPVLMPSKGSSITSSQPSQQSQHEVPNTEMLSFFPLHINTTTDPNNNNNNGIFPLDRNTLHLTYSLTECLTVYARYVMPYLGFPIPDLDMSMLWSREVDLSVQLQMYATLANGAIIW